MNTTETSLGYTAVALSTIAKQDVPADMRLARIIRKASAKDANGLESQGVHIPASVDLAYCMADSTLNAYLVQCVQDVQDKMIRRVTDSGRNIITDSDIAMDVVAQYLEETDENIGRISKDKIEQWFKDEMADTLLVAFANKLGVGDVPTPDEEKKLAQACKGYQDVFATLAAKNPVVDPKIGDRLIKALDMIPASAFTLRIRGIAEKAMKQAEVDLLAL